MNSSSNLKDHRQIGQEQELFFTDDLAPGAVFWLPKGMVIFKELEKYIRDLTADADYLETSTPILIKNSIFHQSGHWDKFGKHKMFNMDIYEENEKKSDSEPNYSLKPMNCPESTVIYRFKTRSYKDLPLRISEIGRLFRREQSGEVSGLLRVRQFVMDDAHIYAREDQIKEEINTILDTMIAFYESLGFKYEFKLATRPNENFAATKEEWDKAEKILSDVLKSKKLKFSIKEGEGAFYGPKVDLHIEAINKDWQLATVQIDLHQPKAFGLKYVDDKGSFKQPAMIHRAIFGSFERFIGILTEHFQGAFPVWLSPIQVEIIPISEKHVDYTRKILSELKGNGIKGELNEKNEPMQAKIREATLQKVPYMIIIGDKEIEKNSLSVRTRNGENFSLNIEDFIKRLNTEIDKKV